MVLDRFIKTYKSSESFLSLFLGLLVVLAVGNQVIGFINQKYTFNEVTEKNNIEQPFEHKNEVRDVYLVKKGDCLYEIARERLGDGNMWLKIAQTNNISDPDIIEVGDKLIIPSTEAIIGPPGSEAINKTINNSLTISPNRPITGDKYTVVANDNLWKICVRAYGDGYQWPKVAKANSLMNPNLLEIGQVLMLPR